MSSEKKLLLCYNRGCGQKFDPNDNKAVACTHHPGTPIFHDAYKGWSCCNKKCTDFTEFLNIKGCTKSFHNSEKPSEPEKPTVDKSKLDEVIEYRAPVYESAIERPPFNQTQITMIPTVSPALLEQVKDLVESSSSLKNNTEVHVGESCKNTSCKATYRGSESNDEVCHYHSGVAIFHEGLKYWSCCQKKTTDFSVFLEQPGCTQGTHLWIATNTKKKIQCRMDWHQTGSHVVVSIYAKKYQPNKSTIKLNPIRLTTNIFFPVENSFYNIDSELQGIIDVENSSVNMLPTKIEIILKKAEPGSWSKLALPTTVNNESKNMKTDGENNKKDDITDRVDAVDLNDL